MNQVPGDEDRTVPRASLPAPNCPSIVVTRRMELDRAPEGHEALEHEQDTRVKVALKP